LQTNNIKFIELITHYNSSGVVEMPTYEYECSSCKKIFEIFQSINDKPLKKCRECGGKLKKLVSSGSGIIFKGAGFYETDYKRKKTESKTEKEKTESKKSSEFDKKETK